MVEATGSSFSSSVSVVELALALVLFGLPVAVVLGAAVVYGRSGTAVGRKAAGVAIAGAVVVLATLVVGVVVSAPASAIWALLFIQLGLLGTAFWVWMLLDCAIHEPTDENDKLIWVLIILFAQVIGATLYLLVRRPQRLAMAGS